MPYQIALLAILVIVLRSCAPAPESEMPGTTASSVSRKKFREGLLAAGAEADDPILNDGSLIRAIVEVRTALNAKVSALPSKDFQSPASVLRSDLIKAATIPMRRCLEALPPEIRVPGAVLDRTRLLEALIRGALAFSDLGRRYESIVPKKLTGDDCSDEALTMGREFEVVISDLVGSGPAASTTLAPGLVTPNRWAGAAAKAAQPDAERSPGNDAEAGVLRPQTSTSGPAAEVGITQAAAVAQTPAVGTLGASMLLPHTAGVGPILDPLLPPLPAQLPQSYQVR